MIFREVSKNVSPERTDLGATEKGEECFAIMLRPIAAAHLVEVHVSVQFKDVAQGIEVKHGIDQV